LVGSPIACALIFRVRDYSSLPALIFFFNLVGSPIACALIFRVRDYSNLLALIFYLSLTLAGRSWMKGNPLDDAFGTPNPL
jgi:ABC-type polysaccharide/polyol phosphate export permease